MIVGWLSALVLAQAAPPELDRQARATVDPSLPEVLRGVVERAIQAELDPKRGAGNAMEILKSERPRYAGDQALALAIDLRTAAVVLRAKFLGNTAAPEGVRYMQALSTFSKLDLTDPGLREWLERTIPRVAEAKERIGTEKARAFKVAVLTQGSSLDKEAIHKELQAAYRLAGITVSKAPADQADFILKVAGLEVRDQAGRATVRVAMEIKSPKDGWQSSLFRTVEAADAKVAVASAVSWLVRIGGRMVLFHWLAANGLRDAVMGKEDGHNHGGPKKQPPVVVAPPGGQSPSKVHIPKIDAAQGPKK